MEALLSQKWFASLLTIAVVGLCAFIVQLVVVRAMKRGFEAARISHASIFVNIVRALIWFVAFLLILRPVFGVEPTAFIAALGVTSIVISFGLQDTVSNIFGGIVLMTSRVIGIGDVIKVGNALGSVRDITWRSTSVALKDGNVEIIPNSLLSKTSLTRYSEKAGCAVVLNFAVKLGVDLEQVEKELIEASERLLKGHLRPEFSPMVRFGDVSAYGIQAKLFAFVGDTISQIDAIDCLSREISSKSWLANALKLEAENS